MGSVAKRAFIGGFCTEQGSLSVSGSLTVSDARRDFLKAMYFGLNILGTVIQVDQSLGVDMHINSTVVGVPYERHLEGFNEVILEGWCDQFMGFYHHLLF